MKGLVIATMIVDGIVEPMEIGHLPYNEPDQVVLGGGDKKNLDELPDGCVAGDKANAFAGGFRLWKNGRSRASSPVN